MACTDTVGLDGGLQRKLRSLWLSLCGCWALLLAQMAIYGVEIGSCARFDNVGACSLTCDQFAPTKVSLDRDFSAHARFELVNLDVKIVDAHHCLIKFDVRRQKVRLGGDGRHRFDVAFEGLARMGIDANVCRLPA